MDWPDPFPGASLEAAGNGSPRKMIVQRQNPAYRSAYIVFLMEMISEQVCRIRVDLL
jgi:hypothetical protein